MIIGYLFSLLICERMIILSQRLTGASTLFWLVCVFYFSVGMFGYGSD
jgi:hypothetical protein